MDEVDHALKRIAIRAKGRTRYEGAPPFDEETLAAEVERLRTTLATVRLFIEDEMIAHAVVVLEGKDARDPSNPSLLKLIDQALGDEQSPRRD